MPGRKSVGIPIHLLDFQDRGADLLWNPHGAASCRFATRPPYRDGRATRPIVAREKLDHAQPTHAPPACQIRDPTSPFP